MAIAMNLPDGGVYAGGPLYAEDLKLTGSSRVDVKYLDHNNHICDSQDGTASAVTGKPLYCAFAAGTVKGVKAGSRVAAVGDATATIDVLKNGTSILSTTIQLDSGNVAYTPENGSLDSTKTSLSAGDVLTWSMSVNAGTGTLPSGVYVALSIDQDYAH